jgi:hypothetical protein
VLETLRGGRGEHHGRQSGENESAAEGRTHHLLALFKTGRSRRRRCAQWAARSNASAVSWAW